MRLAMRLGERLLAADLKLATAESCTGGWIAKRITDVAGSSGWFEAGFVTYSNRAKIAQLGVPEALIAAEGAVCRAVVEAMARGAAERTGAALAVAVSGIAGPGGGSVDKPVGSVWFGFAVSDAVDAELARFPGDRDTVRRLAVDFALAALIERLDG
jgi:nicotinamide-nucleotide amidase